MADTRLIPNSYQTPNSYSDELFPLLTEPELRCLLYAIRRIFGFGHREAPISVAQFVNGTVSRKTGEQLDYGTGLCAESVVKALKSLKQFNVMIETAPSRGRRPTTWGLQLDYAKIDWRELYERQRRWKEAERSKLEKTRNNTRGSTDSDSVLSHRTQIGDDSVLSHRTQTDLAFCPTERNAFCPTERKPHIGNQEETKDNGKPRDSAVDTARHTPSLFLNDLEDLLESLSEIKSVPFRVYVAVGSMMGVPDPMRWGAKEKECAAARRMLTKGYTPLQIIRCVHYHLTTPFWRNNTSMGLAVMQSKIDAWAAMGEPDEQARKLVSRNGREDGGPDVRGPDVNSRLDRWVASGAAEGL